MAIQTIIYGILTIMLGLVSGAMWGLSKHRALLDWLQAHTIRRWMAAMQACGYKQEDIDMVLERMGDRIMPPYIPQPEPPAKKPLDVQLHEKNIGILCSDELVEDIDLMMGICLRYADKLHIAADETDGFLLMAVADRIRDELMQSCGHKFADGKPTVDIERYDSDGHKSIRVMFSIKKKQYFKEVGAPVYFAPMTLDEAITHCEEKADCTQCGSEHKQLAEWLQELKELRKQKPTIYHKFRVGDEIKTQKEESLTITKIDDKGYWSEDLFICDFDEECTWDLVEQKPVELQQDMLSQEKYAKAVDECIYGEQKPAENKGMNLAEEDMTPFQKKVFCIIDTTIEEEQGLKQVCDELLSLAHDEIMQNPEWSEEDSKVLKELIKYHETCLTCLNG